MIYLNKKLFLILATITGSSIFGMIFDNKFLPLYHKTYIRRGCCAHARIQPFFMRAENATLDLDKGPLPDIEGRFDLIQVIKAGLISGAIKNNPLPTPLIDIPSLPFRREGKIEAQGMSFFYDQPIFEFFGIGGSFLFAHINSRNEFCLENSVLADRNGDRGEVLQIKETVNKELGLDPALYRKTLFGDFDLYLRFGYQWCYAWKFRTVTADFKWGMYAPTSKRAPLDNPAAIPLGGNGHWGTYLSFENQYEVKEDLTVGFQFRAIKRFADSFTRRLPLSQEPSQYGAFSRRVQTDPGWTVVFNPYVILEGAREGFGLTAQYYLVNHFEDNIKESRNCLSSEKNGPNIERVEHNSSWGREHVTIGAFYDFSKFSNRCYLPTISLYWDIPVDWQVSKRSARTNCVSLMIESNF